MESPISVLLAIGLQILQCAVAGTAIVSNILSINNISQDLPDGVKVSSASKVKTKKKIVVLTSIAAIVVAIVALVPLSHQALAIFYINQGNKLAVSKNYPEAIKKYQMAVDLAPKSATACRALGMILLETDKTDTGAHAVHYLQRATIDLEPITVETLLSLGETLKHNGQYDAALDAFDRARKLDNSNNSAHYEVGHIYYIRAQKGNEPKSKSQDDFKSASVEFNIVIRSLGPREHLTDSALRLSDWEQDQLDNAKKKLKKIPKDLSGA